MKDKHVLSPRRAFLVFLVAMVGSLTGTLIGPRIVGAFQGAPVWLLPLILALSALLALVAGYAALHLATSRKKYRPFTRGGEVQKIIRAEREKSRRLNSCVA